MTTAAVHLHAQLAADIRRLTGRPTVVVDLKTGPGDVALFLGLRPRHSVLTALDSGSVERARADVAELIALAEDDSTHDRRAPNR